MGETPTIVRNPVDDTDFAAAVDAAVVDGVTTAPELQERLRRAYPKALVRPRELAEERGVVWYVYRDGRWISS
jgi:hypothetical protein